MKKFIGLVCLIGVLNTFSDEISDDLVARFKMLKHNDTVYRNVVNNVPNVTLDFNNVYLLMSDRVAAENLMVAMEAKNLELIAAEKVKETERENRRIDVLEIKGMISNINTSSLPPWHKQLLRRLVSELKE